MTLTGYDRERAVAYAHRWAYERNPAFTNFDDMGGNCTNFASQCLYAGCGVMNYTRDIGWYYRNINDRAAAWTGVEYLYKFLVNNRGPGPFGELTDISQVEPGDLVQLRFSADVFGHTPVIVRVGERPDYNNILVAANSYDTDNRPLSTYNWNEIRFIKIQGARR